MTERKPMSESQIERRVCRYAQKVYGMLTFKWTSPNRAGVLDRIFITREGLIAFIEFKAEGKRDNLTALQHRTAAQLSEYKCEVFVIDSEESGRRLVDLISDANAYYEARYGRKSDLIVPASVSESRH